MTSSAFKPFRSVVGRKHYGKRTVVLSRERVKRSENLPYRMETKEGYLWREVRRDDILHCRKGWKRGRKYVHYVYRFWKNTPNPKPRWS